MEPAWGKCSCCAKIGVFDAVYRDCVDDIGLHHQVVVNEFGRVGIVGMNANNCGCDLVDLVGLFLSKKGLNSGLVGEVQLGMGAGDNLALGYALDQKMAHIKIQQSIPRWPAM